MFSTMNFSLTVLLIIFRIKLSESIIYIISYQSSPVVTVENGGSEQLFETFLMNLFFL